MKRLMVAALVAASLSACSKPAQPSNPPVAAEQNRDTAAPAAGNNSFTQSQAMGHLTNAGYTNVTGMTQDDKGVWHGQATGKDGKSGPVSVDYQGSITAN